MPASTRVRMNGEKLIDSMKGKSISTDLLTSIHFFLAHLDTISHGIPFLSSQLVICSGMGFSETTLYSIAMKAGAGWNLAAQGHLTYGSDMTLTKRSRGYISHHSPKSKTVSLSRKAEVTPHA